MWRTKTLISGDLEYTTYYFYAHNTKSDKYNGGGKYNFIVKTYDAFKIKNVDKDYQLKNDGTFKKIDVG